MLKKTTKQDRQCAELCRWCYFYQGLTRALETGALLAQTSDHTGRELSWLDASDEHGFVVCIGQSRVFTGDGPSWRLRGDRPAKFDRSLRSGFVPDEPDWSYLSNTVQEARDSLIEHTNNECYIDEDRIHVMGFSNGAFVAMQLGYEPLRNHKAIQLKHNFTFVPASVCVYMGGMAMEQLDELGIDGLDLPALSREIVLSRYSRGMPEADNATVMLCTGELDINRHTTYRAAAALMYLGVPFQFREGLNMKHYYWAQDTSAIVEFFGLA